MKRAAVLGLICVVAWGVSGFAFATLGGLWDANIIINPQTPTISIDTTIEVNYIVGTWSFGSVTLIEDAEWTSQSFGVSGALGLFTSIGSSLRFDPTAISFLSWNLNAKMQLAGVTFAADFTLTPGVTVTKLAALGTMGDVGVNAQLTLGSGNGCDFEFNTFRIVTTFPFCCDLSITGSLEFDCETGFAGACFATSFPIFGFGTATTSICFLPESKDVEFGFTPAEELVGMCVEVYGWTGIGFEGLAISCTLGNVTFRGETWMGEENAPTGLGLLRDTEYFEAYQIKTVDPGCCGPFDFDLTFYFADTANTLFNVALIESNFGIVLSDSFRLKMGLQIDTVLGAFAEWSIGFVVTWPTE